ncbi:hypothetical protein FVE85_5744 [Porphyridium purpureum]|uniref:Transmembrane protein 69 n=1 Tax=Porphyridium purpureum TaxID=35688 RepID=A0A5J4Z2I6_PORPP|nr:hypothetical protein FVE85_5744 [Porphyridium purpureum]|eukprot:POR3965..scf295_1
MARRAAYAVAPARRIMATFSSKSGAAGGGYDGAGGAAGGVEPPRLAREIDRANEFKQFNLWIENFNLHQRVIPMVPSLLGFAGLVPFVSSAGVILSAYVSEGKIPPAVSDFALTAHITYGAVILSFLGAVHWGVALRMPSLSSADLSRRFLYGVTPSLFGWAACLMPSSYGATNVLLAGFIVAYNVDQRQLLKMVPSWYLSLRRPLSLGACLSILFVSYTQSGISLPSFLSTSPREKAKDADQDKA